MVQMGNDAQNQSRFEISNVNYRNRCCYSGEIDGELDAPFVSVV